MTARTLSRQRGEGWGEGVSPLGAELPRSNRSEGPLTLVRFALTRPLPRTRGEVALRLLSPPPRPI